MLEEVRELGVVKFNHGSWSLVGVELLLPCVLSFLNHVLPVLGLTLVVNGAPWCTAVVYRDEMVGGGDDGRANERTRSSTVSQDLFKGGGSFLL